jgi:hypothetical protein
MPGRGLAQLNMLRISQGKQETEGGLQKLSAGFFLLGNSEVRKRKLARIEFM